MRERGELLQRLREIMQQAHVRRVTEPVDVPRRKSYQRKTGGSSTGESNKVAAISEAR